MYFSKKTSIVGTDSIGARTKVEFLRGEQIEPLDLETRGDSCSFTLEHSIFGYVHFKRVNIGEDSGIIVDSVTV